MACARRWILMHDASFLRCHNKLRPQTLLRDAVESTVEASTLASSKESRILNWCQIAAFDTRRMPCRSTATMKSEQGRLSFVSSIELLCGDWLPMENEAPETDGVVRRLSADGVVRFVARGRSPIAVGRRGVRLVPGLGETHRNVKVHAGTISRLIAMVGVMWGAGWTRELEPFQMIVHFQMGGQPRAQLLQPGRSPSRLSRGRTSNWLLQTGMNDRRRV